MLSLVISTGSLVLRWLQPQALLKGTFKYSSKGRTTVVSYQLTSERCSLALFPCPGALRCWRAALLVLARLESPFDNNHLAVRMSVILYLPLPHYPCQIEITRNYISETKKSQVFID